MSRLDAAQPIAVRIGDCLCANRPHDGSEGHDDGDIVYLAPQLSIEGGLAANAAIAAHGEDPAVLARELGLSLVLGGVTGWNFLDDAGKPIPATPENVQKALPWGAGGQVVAEKADELYSESIVSPLLAKLQTLSANGQTATSTSATRPLKAGTRRRRASS